MLSRIYITILYNMVVWFIPLDIVSSWSLLKLFCPNNLSVPLMIWLDFFNPCLVLGVINSVQYLGVDQWVPNQWRNSCPLVDRVFHTVRLGFTAHFCSASCPLRSQVLLPELLQSKQSAGGVIPLRGRTSISPHWIPHFKLPLIQHQLQAWHEYSLCSFRLHGHNQDKSHHRSLQ